MTFDLHSRPHSNENVETFLLIFTQISQLIWMKFNVLPQPVGLSKLVLNLFCIVNIQERESDFRDFINYIIYIGLCLDSCELISFKQGLIMDSIQPYSFIAV